MKVSIDSADIAGTETDYVKVVHPQFGTFYVSAQDTGWQQGFILVFERSMAIHPRMDNSIRIVSEPPKRTGGVKR